jgi:hypothetical protein
MTRAAVEAGFEHYLDEMLAVAAREFNVVAALRNGVRGPGARVTDRLLKRTGALERHVVEPELDAHRHAVLAQFDVILDYAASDDGLGAFADTLLARDSFYQSIRPGISPTRRDEIRERLLARDRRLGEAVAPLLESPHEEFWPAAVDVYEADRIGDLVSATFSFTGPLTDYPEAFVFETTFDPAAVLGGLGSLLSGGLPRVTVEYTDEATRVMRRAEETVRHRAMRDAERQVVE